MEKNRFQVGLWLGLETGSVEEHEGKRNKEKYCETNKITLRGDGECYENWRQIYQNFLGERRS